MPFEVAVLILVTVITLSLGDTRTECNYCDVCKRNKSETPCCF